MLRLELSLGAGRVDVSADEGHAQTLQQLRSRFGSATSLSGTSFELDLDELLLNLNELAIWPVTDTDIRWDSNLLALVEGNARDAEILRRGLEGDATVAEIAMPDVTLPPLTDFQHRDLERLLQLAHGANFSVPGAGKTRVALSVFEARRAAGEIQQMLVVAPKSAFDSWLDEIATCYAPGALTAAVMDSGTVPAADAVIINYERLSDALSSLIGWLRTRKALLVLDEAHRMKLGPSGAWGTACLALAPFATRRLVLTGTPAPNGARDLENIFAFVWPGQGRRVVSGAVAGANLSETSKVLKPFFVRTTKAELGLPPMDVRIRRLTLPPLHREIYDALLGQFARGWSPSNQDLEALGRVVLYLLMAATSPALLAVGGTRHEPLPYRVPPLQPPIGSSLADIMRDLPDYEMSPKYQETLRIVAENAAAGRKTLVWSTFIRNLTSLELLLRRFAPVVIHGGTLDRSDQLKKFRSDPNCLVLLSNPSTLGEGVSLHHSCHDAIYVDRDFAAGRFLQSLDRIHRLGLGHDIETRVTVLLASDTLDEIVERRLAMKLTFLGSILDDPSVAQLGDLFEDADVNVGMDKGDFAELTRYLIAGGVTA